MQARVVTAQLKQGTIMEASRIYRESVVPAAAREKGNGGAILLVQSDTDKAISITFWDTVEDMVAGEESGYFLEQLQGFAGMFSTSPTRDHFDVAYRPEML